MSPLFYCFYEGIHYLITFTQNRRVNCIHNGWEALKMLARVENLQLRDLRTYFNHILKTNYNFTSKEAGAYIGNNEVVNELHYSPYHEPTIREKMRKLPLKEALGGS